MKLENCHNSWTSKMHLFVTDMNENDKKTAEQLQQVAQLLQSFETVCDN